MSQNKTYWLITVPKRGQDVLSTLNARIQKDHDECYTHKFDIPELAVGTLDVLYSLSDDLFKYDAQVLNITTKISHVLNEMLNKKVPETLSVDQTNIDTWLTRFPWDEARYPIRDNIRELSEKLRADVLKIEEDLKSKTSEYQQLSTSLSADERKKTGTLMQKSLTEVVKKNDFLETDFMTTLFIVVPKFAAKTWAQNYEELCEYVVPRSAKLITEDQENMLYSCIVFKKFVEDFKTKAREMRFFVRDFNIAQVENVDAAKEESKKKESERDLLKKNLITWCKINFSEAFIAWIHLKAIRAFVESVLRYGLPCDFQAVLIKPQKKEDKKLRKTLDDLYHNLGIAHLMDTSSGGDEEAGIAGAGEEFYPYVFTSIDLDFAS